MLRECTSNRHIPRGTFHSFTSFILIQKNGLHRKVGLRNECRIRNLSSSPSPPLSFTQNKSLSHCQKNTTLLLLLQSRNYATIKKREVKPSPYIKSIRFMIYFFAFTGFFFFILTRVDDIEPKLSPIHSGIHRLKRSCNTIEVCLKESQFGVLPCLNKLRMNEFVKNEKNMAYYSDILIEMAEKCDSMMEFAKADELYNEAISTGDERALVAYGTYLYEKNRELHRSSEYLKKALESLDPEGLSLLQSLESNNDNKTGDEKSFASEKLKRKKMEKHLERLQKIHKTFDQSKLTNEDEILRVRLAGVAWNNLGMIYKSKSIDNREDLNLLVLIMRCFQRGAYFGDPYSNYNTGLVYMTGHTGIMKHHSNYPLARKYFEQSSTIEAKLALGTLSESGLASTSGKPDLKEAYSYYKKAHDEGYSHTRYLKQLLKLTYLFVMNSIAGQK